MLRHTHGHQSQASELLGIDRKTLRYKLREMGIVLDRIVTDRVNGVSEPQNESEGRFAPSMGNNSPI